MNLTELQSKTIDYIRFPLAVLVVFIHSSQTEVSMQSIDYSSLTGGDVYNILTIIFSKTIALIAVPLFFTISGFLFFLSIKQWSKHEYFKKLKNRIKTLLVPYLVWNAIVLLLALCRAIYVYYTTGEVNHLLEQLSSVWGWIKPFWNQAYFGPATNAIGQEFYITYPYNGPFWFIRDLIGMCLVSPLIYLIARYAKIWGLIILAAALYTNIWLHVPGFGIEAFFYFTLGAYLSIHKKNIVEQVAKIRVPSCIICLIAFLLCTYGIPQGLLPFEIPYKASILLFILSGGISIINIVAWLLSKGKIEVNPVLAKSSFMIFAAHGLALGAIGPFFHKFFNRDYIVLAALDFFLFPIFVSLVLVALYYIVTRYFPRLSMLLVGSRGKK